MAKQEKVKVKHAVVGEDKATKPTLVDQESQVVPVQKISDEQTYGAPVIPGSVLVDPEVGQGPIKKEPARDPEAPDNIGTNPDDLGGYGKEPEEEVKEEPELDEDGKPIEKKKEAKEEEELEPGHDATRYGAGKEVPLDRIDNGEGRHFPNPIHGGITGGTNEWPR